jgi:hypothetical protein
MHSLPLLCVRVQHPNLVGWHEVVIAPSQAEVSIIMELAAGGNGRRALMARGALPEDGDWPSARQVGCAVPRGNVLRRVSRSPCLTSHPSS